MLQQLVREGARPRAEERVREAVVVGEARVCSHPLTESLQAAVLADDSSWGSGFEAESASGVKTPGARLDCCLKTMRVNPAKLLECEFLHLTEAMLAPDRR